MQWIMSSDPSGFLGSKPMHVKYTNQQTGLENMKDTMGKYGVVGIGTYAPSYRAWWGRAAQVTIEGMLIVKLT